MACHLFGAKPLSEQKNHQKIKLETDVSKMGNILSWPKCVKHSVDNQYNNGRSKTIITIKPLI